MESEMKKFGIWKVSAAVMAYSRYSPRFVLRDLDKCEKAQEG